jgi:hypothetical protein
MAEGREAGTPRVGVRRVSFMRAPVESSLAAGRAALVRAAWSEARKEFASVLALEETSRRSRGWALRRVGRWMYPVHTAVIEGRLVSDDSIPTNVLCSAFPSRLWRAR